MPTFRPITRVLLVVSAAALLSCIGGGGEQPEMCAQYIECIGEISPELLPGLTPTYGEEGSCWQQGRDERAACEAACSAGLGSCDEVYDDSDQNADDY